MSSCKLQQRWWAMLLKRSMSVQLITVCVQLGPWKLSVTQSSGVSGLLKYWSERKDSWDFRNCLYIMGVSCWRVSVKLGSTVTSFPVLMCVLVSSPDLIWRVYRLQYNAILKAIRAGVGFGSGTETRKCYTCMNDTWLYQVTFTLLHGLET